MHGAGNEEGLLSVAVDPAFATNRHVWAYYSNTGQPRRTVVARFTASTDGTLDPGSELIVLEIAQPYANHNGGALRFGPDGMLYLGVGDGGSGGDPQGHGQDLGTLLGTVIRISVAGASEVEPYALLDNNPFVGVDGAREEIWAYGLRNPWRMSFDPLTGALWQGDVGQNRQEEVNRIERGGNYGWNVVEGSLCFGAASCDRTGFVAPVAVYDLGGGRCAVTGGVVARNATADNVEGHYLFGDYCSGDLWAIPGDTDGRSNNTVEPVHIASGLGNIASINQIGSEIYLATFNSPLLRLVNQ
ncbi:MAG: PQQ-dependent sugar dehydrogenase [bacterium]|nr:PQQ-dependent sugar dehydrogenase [bacterium]